MKVIGLSPSDILVTFEEYMNMFQGLEFQGERFSHPKQITTISL